MNPPLVPQTPCASLCLPVPLFRLLSPTVACIRRPLAYFFGETLNSMSPPTIDVRAIAAAALDLSSAAQGHHHVNVINPPSFALPPLEPRSIPAPTNNNNRLPQLPPLNSVFFPWSPIQVQQHHPYLLQQPVVSTGPRIPPPGYPDAAWHPHLLLHPPAPVSTPVLLPHSRHWPGKPVRPLQPAPNVNEQHAEIVCDRICK